eukprot:TRINITY_DN3716_c0_g1_i1.p1 TRINITY_DN3716_c0_g1~~TRINITY_DN3716_c0_g1_i1.p1  ORF type:complete len:228 (-),score=37.67 TRINITY_DN3716_c0_g1_i1:43-726(-)
MEHEPIENDHNEPNKNLLTERYEDQLEIWPKKGQHVLAQYDDDTIIVYQAFKPSIAQWAVTNQKFGGPDYNTTRMTWVKTNFLWMMYRSKWGTKHDQQHTLAVWIKRSSFEQLLSRAVVNKSHEEMKAGEKYKKPKGARGTVRLQWDPDHRPDGSETVRRAIQIGFKGIEDFTNGDMIVKIEDISEFVAQQYALVTKGDLKSLVVPKERVYHFADKAIAKHIKLDKE